MRQSILLFLGLCLFTGIKASAYDAKIDGIYYDFSGIEAFVTYGSTMYSGSVSIPASVSYNGNPYTVRGIGRSAFSYCSGLTSVTIPDGVTSIGSLAFDGCSGLSSITIPGSVTSIGDYAFEFCNGLNTIVVSQWNSRYDSRGDCNAIIEKSSNSLIVGCKNTVIPDGVTSIGNGAFSGCDGIISITIPNSVTSVGEAAFSGCTGLTSVIIPNSVTSIGQSAFNSCIGLTSITIPDNVTSIANSTFSLCYGLTSVTLPESLTSIGYSAFYYCSNLKDVYCHAKTVPTASSGAFSSSIGSATLHVPASSMNAYKAAEPWKFFGSIVSIEGVAMGDVNGDGEVDLSDAIMVTYYSLHEVPSNFIEAAADMNGDGEIDLSDAIIIIYKSLGVK